MIITEKKNLRAALLSLDERDREVILESLCIRALDRQGDKYGEGRAEDAADLFLALTGEDPHEQYAYGEGAPPVVADA